MMHAGRRPGRAGTTLIELIVVIAILGVAMTVVGTAVVEIPPHSPTLQDEIVAAQRSAIERGRPEQLIVNTLERAHALSIMPDGSVIADSSLHVDRWTGRVK
jgi:prepilin-type N-terminal cleavage/methylation domain-containing protein